MTDEKKSNQNNLNGIYTDPSKLYTSQSNASEVNAEKNAKNVLPPIETDKQFDEKDILQEKPTNTDEGDLLSAIARPEDFSGNVAENKKSKKKGFSFSADSFSVKNIFQSWQKKWNVFCEKYKSFFYWLNILWMVAKISFYCIGLSFFVLCVFVYFSFKPIVRSYLDGRGLSNITFSGMSHSLTEFTLRDVSEKNGLFTIKKIKVQYNFADLLNKSVPLVEIDGMKLYIEEGTNEAKNVGAFIRILWRLGFLERGAVFSIQSLRMENSVLYVGNKEYKLPVSFSGVGSLAEERHIIFPITLRNDYVNLGANVKVDISNTGTVWTMEIVTGSLNFPGLPTEDLKGTVVIKTRKGTFSSLNFSGTLRREQLSKDCVIEISPSDAETFSVKSTLTVPQKDVSTTYLLNLSKISVAKDLKSFETSSPVFAKITNFRHGSFRTDAIQLSAKGFLKCDTEGCFYQVQKKSDMILFSPSYSFQDTEFFITYPLRAIIEPTKNRSISFKDGKLDVAAIFSKVAFDIRRKAGNVLNQKTSLDLSKAELKGNFILGDEASQVDFKVAFNKIDDDMFLLTKGDLEVDANENGFASKLVAKKAQLRKFDYFKPEFNLDMTFTSDYYFTMAINSNKNDLSLNLNGYYNPDVSEILMAIQTNNPITFGKNQMSPFEISSLFSERLKDVTGRVNLKGQIYYKGSRSISGPLNVLFDNVSFTYGNTRVENLNTVLNLSQVVPLGAQGGQNIFVEKVTNVLPFSNVNAQVFFDAGRKQFNISSLSTDIGNYQLVIDPMWYNYTSPIFNFALKGRSVPAQTIVNSTKIDGLKIQGNANVALSIQLEDADVSLKSLEMNIPSEGIINYTPKTYINPFLENLRQLDFRKLSVYLTEQDNNMELIFSSDNKSNKLRKKTNFRFKIKEPLENYILSPAISVPDFVSEEKGSF